MAGSLRSVTINHGPVISTLCQENDPPMKLKFGTAKNGWLPAELEADGDHFAFDVSYIPNDFLLELVEALHHILKESGEWFACLSQEPVEVEWRFYRIQDGVVFTLVEHPDSKRNKGTGTTMLEMTGSPLEIALPLWRGLRELAGRKIKEGFNTHWTQNWAHPFPERALDTLSEKIDNAKRLTKA